MHTIRELIREYLNLMMDTKPSLDPEPGHSSMIVGHDLYQDYIVWARTNGYDPLDLDNLEEYANTRYLDIPEHEIANIRHKLGYEYS